MYVYIMMKYKLEGIQENNSLEKIKMMAIGPVVKSCSHIPFPLVVITAQLGNSHIP